MEEEKSVLTLDDVDELISKTPPSGFGMIAIWENSDWEKTKKEINKLLEEKTNKSKNRFQTQRSILYDAICMR